MYEDVLRRVMEKMFEEASPVTREDMRAELHTIHLAILQLAERLSELEKSLPKSNSSGPNTSR